MRIHVSVSLISTVFRGFARMLGLVVNAVADQIWDITLVLARFFVGLPGSVHGIAQCGVPGKPVCRTQANRLPRLGVVEIIMWK
jgi:hypothetical protein